MRTIRFFLATICCVAIFTACEKSTIAKVPKEIANTTWGNYTMATESYQILSFSENECIMKVIPAKEYRENPESMENEEYNVEKWSYTYTKPDVQFIPVNEQSKVLSGVIEGGVSERLRMQVYSNGSFWSAFWSM